MSDNGGYSLKASRKFVCKRLRELLRREREGGPKASFEEFKEICLKEEIPRIQKTFGGDKRKLEHFRKGLDELIEWAWRMYPTWLKNRTSALGKRSGEARRKKAIAEDYPKIVQTYHKIGNLKGTADELTISRDKVRYALRWYESLSESEKRKVLGDLYGKVPAIQEKRKLESRQEDILAAMKAGWQKVMHIANEAKCHRRTVYNFIKNAPKRPGYDKIKDFLPKLKTRRQEVL